MSYAKNGIFHPIGPICLAVGLASITAQSGWASDDAEFRDKFLEHLVIETSSHGERFVGDVLRFPVREVAFGFDAGESQSSGSFSARGFQADRAVARLYENDDGALVLVSTPTTSEPLPYFDDLIHPDFRLTEGTADDFQSALKAIMPDNLFERLDGESIRSREGEWHFLTGTFFDDLKGFVVTTDDEGRVQAVSYDLKLDPEG